MTEIRPAKDGERDIVRDLFREYLLWANERVNAEFGVNFDIDSMLEEDMNAPEKFMPPNGRLLLAVEGEEVTGIGCLKNLTPGVGEIKRMYVRPSFRGRSVGRLLLEALIAEAKQVGYSTIRLDSAGFMKEAHSLYRSAGFQDIEPYAESEIPADFQQHWVFMEKDLGEGSGRRIWPFLSAQREDDLHYRSSTK